MPGIKPSAYSLFSEPAKAPGEKRSGTESGQNDAAVRPLSVTELNDRASALLEKNLGRVTVAGEISGFLNHRSGHWYFTLKDDTGQVACCCFRGNQRGVSFVPRDGMAVIARGQVTIYAARGNYQLVVDGLKAAGDGSLQQRFDLLKAKLNSEGLFAQERKRPIPRFIKRLAIITSSDGAAIRDFLKVAGERHAGLNVLICPVNVQGSEAAPGIARMIDYVSVKAKSLGVDALLLTRGGGSIEDLWAFNEEAVVRALAGCSIPTLSAIGHEIDFTLCDFAADVRAPTPTAAATLLAVDTARLHQDLSEHLRQVARSMAHRLEREQGRLNRLRSQFREPSRQMMRYRQQLDGELMALERSLRELLDSRARRLDAIRLRLERDHPRHQLEQRRQRMNEVKRQLLRGLKTLVERRKQGLASASHKLTALSPLAVLGRGYSVTLLAETGQAVRRPSDAPPGSRLRVLVGEGELRATVDESRQKSGESHGK